MSKLSASLIVCSHDGSSRLPAVLQAIEGQRLPSPIVWEVLLVDSASHEDLGALGRRLWKRSDVLLKPLREDRPGLSLARTRGLEAASGDIASFIDDDNWISPQWLARVLENFEADPTLSALGGYCAVRSEDPIPPWFHQLAKSFAVGHQTSDGNRAESQRLFLWGAGLSLRRTVWKKLREKNFEFFLADREGSKLSSGGDSELCLAIQLVGGKLAYDPELRLEHVIEPHKLTKAYLFSLYEGFGRSRVLLDIYRSIAGGKLPSLLAMRYFLYGYFRDVWLVLRWLFHPQRAGWLVTHHENSATFYCLWGCLKERWMSFKKALRLYRFLERFSPQPRA